MKFTEMETKIGELENEITEIESLLLDVEFSKIGQGVKSDVLKVLEDEKEALKEELCEVEQEYKYIQGGSIKMKLQTLVPTEQLNDIVAELELDIDTDEFLDYEQVFMRKDRDITVSVELMPNAQLIDLESFIEKVTTTTPVKELLEIMEREDLPLHQDERLSSALDIVVGWEYVESLGSQFETDGRWNNIVTYAYKLRNKEGKEIDVGITMSEGKTEMQNDEFWGVSLVEPYEVTVVRFRKVQA